MTEVETRQPEKPEKPEEPEVREERRVMVTRPDCTMSDPLERAMQQLAESIEDVETGGEAGAGLSSAVLPSHSQNSVSTQ